MRRRWKRRLLWAAVLLGVLLLAIPATVAQAGSAIETRLAGGIVLTTLVLLLALAGAVAFG